MESMAYIVGQREQAAKAVMKKSYEKTTSCKEYPTGSMVLIHVAQLMGQWGTAGNVHMNLHKRPPNTSTRSLFRGEPTFLNSTHLHVDALADDRHPIHENCCCNRGRTGKTS